MDDIIKYLERRQHDRQEYSGKIFFATNNHLYEGNLVNFSQTGLFIRSRILLPVGKIITVAPPYALDKNDKRKGRIVRCDGEGFGVKFIRQVMNQKSFERRREFRQIYTGNVLFATKNKLYVGELKNFSKDGLFIKINEPLTIGEIIKVALPYSKNRNDKEKGIITWSNQEGFGVKLLRTFEWRPLIIWQGSFS